MLRITRNEVKNELLLMSLQSCILNKNKINTVGTNASMVMMMAKLTKMGMLKENKRGREFQMG